MISGYLLTFLFSFGLVYLLTPFVKMLALHFGAVDMPDDRKVHETPTPRWGGLALAPGILVGVLFAYFGTHIFREGLRTLHHHDEVYGIAGACLLMLFVGLVDDRGGVPAKVKLLFQIIAALWLVAHGVAITFITNPISHHLVYLRSAIAVPLSVLWIVGVTNAINLLDGLDGLLAGVSTISSLTLFAIALGRGHVFSGFVLMAMSGATLAFLRYNFNPAQIFLGDAGSLFLGILWASLSIAGALKTSTVTVVVPLLILGIPLADTLFAILRRFGKGESIFKPDKEHLHHRLLKLGWSQRKTVLVFYAVSIFLGGLAIVFNQWYK